MRVFYLTLLLAGATTFGAGAAAKKRIAIFDFANPPAQTNTASSPFPWMANVNLPTSVVRDDVGRAVTDLVIDRLVRDGACSVVERNELDKLLKEQNLSNSDRVDPATAARLGRILGVDALVVGTITRYDHSDHTTGHGHSFGGFHASGLYKSTHELKADVQISARIVSPDTAEILEVAQGLGEADRKDVKEDSRDVNYGGGNPIADVQAEATKLSVTDLAAKLETALSKLPARKRSIEAVIADVSSSRIIINAGSLRGVKVGDRYEVWRQGKPIRDPETGKILRYDDQKLGEAVITEVDELSAAAKYAGPGPAQTGDRVRSEVANQ